MRTVLYTDQHGYKRRVLLRDEDDESMAEFGIPADPPSVDNIDCGWLLREIHNALVDNGLFTWQDVQKSPVGLNAAHTVVKRALSGIYRMPDESG